MLRRCKPLVSPLMALLHLALALVRGKVWCGAVWIGKRGVLVSSLVLGVDRVVCSWFLLVGCGVLPPLSCVTFLNSCLVDTPGAIPNMQVRCEVWENQRHYILKWSDSMIPGERYVYTHIHTYVQHMYTYTHVCGAGAGVGVW